MNNTIRIKENNISIGKYLRYAMNVYMKSWWWAYVLPLALCLCLSVLNVNFIFAAIVLLFLVFTMILFFVIIYYGLVPESRYSTQNKEIELSSEGLVLYIRKNITIEDNDVNEVQQYEIEKVVLAWGRFTHIDGKDDCLLLRFNHPKYSFLAIPYEAFDDEEKIRCFLAVLRTYII